ncbi:hemin uptake protein HemP [Aeoliella mucimassa]|uniref:Hemin uptake protein hemP n=1 Tax=Aeoliella mucimassa TaxID=2527972 RepID=A0A518AUA8_9BACT|nr:hemin uptake protein HemP [Aeoliella mucimassa]QDU58275.1 Hemin uptake protein hemP [Aeoliella mucimassa]
MYNQIERSGAVGTVERTRGACEANSSEGAVILQSRELLKGRREVWIEHLGEMYRLRTTSRGRLYLTK